MSWSSLGTVTTLRHSPSLPFTHHWCSTLSPRISAKTMDGVGFQASGSAKGLAFHADAEAGVDRLAQGIGDFLGVAPVVQRVGLDGDDPLAGVGVAGGDDADVERDRDLLQRVGVEHGVVDDAFAHWAVR